MGPNQIPSNYFLLFCLVEDRPANEAKKLWIIWFLCWNQSYLQQLLVGKGQDALKDHHVGAVHRLLQAHMQASLHSSQMCKRSRARQSLNQPAPAAGHSRSVQRVLSTHTRSVAATGRSKDSPAIQAPSSMAPRLVACTCVTLKKRLRMNGFFNFHLLCREKTKGSLKKRLITSTPYGGGATCDGGGFLLLSAMKLHFQE